MPTNTYLRHGAYFCVLWVLQAEVRTMSREVTTFSVQVSNEGVRSISLCATLQYFETDVVIFFLSFVASFADVLLNQTQARGGDAVVLAFVKGLNSHSSSSSSSNFGVPPSQRLFGFERVFLQPGQVLGMTRIWRLHFVVPESMCRRRSVHFSFALACLLACL